MIWPTKKLGEIIELHYGKGIPKHDRKPDGKYPVYGANGVLDRSDKYLVDGDAIIVGRKGSAGEVTKVSGKFWPSDVTYYVLGNSKINIDYLFHSLKNLNLQRLAVGVKPGINRNRIYELQIPLPPLAEQKKIVTKLEGLLGKIKEAKRLRAEAEEAAQNLLPSELHRIFTQQHSNILQNVGMSDSPSKNKRWEEKELGELFDITSSKRVFKSEWETLGVPFYRAREIVSMAKGKAFKSPIYISEGLYEKYKKKYGVPKTGDILATGVGTLGITYCVKDNDKFYFKDGNIIWLKNKSGVNPIFVDYFFKSDLLRKQVDENAGGATVRTFTIKTANKIKIPLPPLAEQKKIVARLDSLSEKIKKLRTYQSQTRSDFTVLEQSILSKSFQHSCLPVSGGRI